MCVCVCVYVCVRVCDIHACIYMIVCVCVCVRVCVCESKTQTPHSQMQNPKPRANMRQNARQYMKSAAALPATSIRAPIYYAYLLLTLLHITQGKYATDHQAIDEECGCFTCRQHSRAYLHHLLKAHEPVAFQLLTVSHMCPYMSHMCPYMSHMCLYIHISRPMSLLPFSF